MTGVVTRTVTGVVTRTVTGVVTRTVTGVVTRAATGVATDFMRDICILYFDVGALACVMPHLFCA